MTLQTAYDYVKERRPIIHPNVGFWRQLREYEAKISARPPSRQDGGGHPINGGDNAPLATGVKRKHNGELTPGMANKSFLCLFLFIYSSGVLGGRQEMCFYQTHVRRMPETCLMV